MDLFAGRYALRYGKVAGEAIKKQMAQIPGGLVSSLIMCNTVANCDIYIWFSSKSSTAGLGSVCVLICCIHFNDFST